MPHCVFELNRYFVMRQFPPIFIVGCQRSGTTLMQRIINAHPHIACPSESKFVHALLDVYRAEQSRQGLHFMGFTDDDILKQIRAFAEHFFHRYQKKYNKQRWADKNTHYLQSIELLDCCFDHEPHYIALLRNGLDVCISLSKYTQWGVMQRRMNKGMDAYEAGLSLWVEQNCYLEAFQKAHAERVCLVRFEELQAHPRAELMRVFAHINEPCAEQVMNYNEQPHDDGYGDINSRIHTSIINDPHQYDDIKQNPRLRSLAKQYAEALAKWGYNSES